MNEDVILYKNLLVDIKNRIRQGQLRANLAANAELLATYWDIGYMIHRRQKDEGWGKGVIPRLARDLKNELAEVKGFSERNILRMLTFYKEYSGFSISPLAVAKLEEDSFRQPIVAQLNDHPILQPSVAKSHDEIAKLPLSQLENQQIKIQLINLTGWAHHIILIQKVKDLSTRFWYMQQTVANGWSRDTLAAPFTERELELGLVKNVEKFLLELGAGFAFVGRQYKLEISDKEFYIDLLFYHLRMRCFVVIELKKGDFIPEYAGKMNFYCSAVDDMLKHTTDQPTIGLILCQGKDKLFAEYSLKDINKPIGISEYDLTRALPDNFKGSLPSIEEIEEALSPGQITQSND